MSESNHNIWHFHHSVITGNVSLQSDLQFAKPLKTDQPCAKLIHLFVSEDQVKISRLSFCFFTKLSFGDMFALGVFHEILHLCPHPFALIAWIILKQVCAATGYASVKDVCEMATSPEFCLSFATIQNQLTHSLTMMWEHCLVLHCFLLKSFSRHVDCLTFPSIMSCHVLSST